MNQVVATPVVETVKNVFNFSVDKFPLSGPDNMRTEWFGLFRSDTSKPVGTGSVTSRYVPHQTDDVLALVESAAEAFDGIGEVKCHFREGHYVTVQPSRDFRKNIFGTMDNIFPRVVIRAGYDMRAFNASIGFYRDLCLNLGRLQSVRGTSVRINHTSGLRSKMNELIQTFGQLRDGWDALATTAVRLESQRVSMVDFLDQVYGQPVAGETTRAVTIHENRTKAIFTRLANERVKMGKPAMTAGSRFEVSAWEAFNAIQGYTQHDATRRGNPGDFDRILLAAEDSAVLKAESLVMALAS